MGLKLIGGEKLLLFCVSFLPFCHDFSQFINNSCDIHAHLPQSTKMSYSTTTKESIDKIPGKNYFSQASAYVTMLKFLQ